MGVGSVIGCVIGIGPGWEECARNTATAMERCTGVECRAITDWLTVPLNHPSWEKCRLQERFPGEDLLIFDADLMPIVRWNPRVYAEDKLHDIAMARDEHSKAVKAECVKYALSWQSYCNAGLIIIKKDCPVLRDALTMYPNGGSWAEQTAVNICVTPSRRRILPRRLNVITRYGRITPRARSGACNPHFVGVGKDPARLLAIQKELLRV